MTALLIVLKIVGLIVLLLLLYLLFAPLRFLAELKGDAHQAVVEVRFLPLRTDKISLKVWQKDLELAATLQDVPDGGQSFKSQVKGFLRVFEQKEQASAAKKPPAADKKAAKKKPQLDVFKSHWQDLAASISCDKLALRLDCCCGDPAVTAIVMGAVQGLLGALLTVPAIYLRRFPAPPQINCLPLYDEDKRLSWQLNCIAGFTVFTMALKAYKIYRASKRKEQAK